MANPIVSDLAMNAQALIPWETIRKEFGDDGELLDLLITGAGLHGWQRFLAFGKSAELDMHFFVDCVEVSIPNSVEDIFALYPEKVARLSFFHLDGLCLDSNFFSQEMVDVAIPVNGMSEDRFTILLEFMAALGLELGKDVTLNHDCQRDTPFLRYSCATRDFKYTPSS